jgi:hypothetical protein
MVTSVRQRRLKRPPEIPVSRISYKPSPKRHQSGSLDRSRSLKRLKNELLRLVKLSQAEKQCSQTRSICWLSRSFVNQCAVLSNSLTLVYVVRRVRQRQCDHLAGSQNNQWVR